MKNKKLKWALMIAIILILVAVTFFVVGRLMSDKSDAITPSADTTSQSTTQSIIPDDSVSFPYAIPGTNLVIQSVRSYDGVFLEDGSNREVTGISAMVLQNSGKTAVEYAQITLNQGNSELNYKAVCIPAGATVVIQESNASQYLDSKYTSCSANVAEIATLEMSETLVKIEEVENGTLLVTNLTDSAIPCVRVFYKFAFEKGSIYVGGITYTAELEGLEPGQSQKLTANHFAAGSSEVVMVRTYED